VTQCRIVQVFYINLAAMEDRRDVSSARCWSLTWRSGSTVSFDIDHAGGNHLETGLGGITIPVYSLRAVIVDASALLLQAQLLALVCRCCPDWIWLLTSSVFSSSTTHLRPGRSSQCTTLVSNELAVAAGPGNRLETLVRHLDDEAT
jgi:hypothetical protein